MDSTTMLIIGAVIGLGVGAIVLFNYFKKRNLEKLFNQVYETTKQVPKQKKNSFLLLMFKESMASAKNKSKSTSSIDNLNNPKYLEIQLMQMSKILKDSSKVEDKTIKNALGLLDDYLAWEKEKNAEVKQSSKNKAS